SATEYEGWRLRAITLVNSDPTHQLKWENASLVDTLLSGRTCIDSSGAAVRVNSSILGYASDTVSVVYYTGTTAQDCSSLIRLQLPIVESSPALNPSSRSLLIQKCDPADSSCSGNGRLLYETPRYIAYETDYFSFDSNDPVNQSENCKITAAEQT